ncbi:nucleic acid dioxygenase ALKBH1-like [Saccoglossus kowalevskii]|uniref:Alkylated DNA repair protein alkB homolog 1-like n=1 Tax=Saccoglossus kowalevskii TaxID=10224 RepID=A0ABM0H0B2_SACKO|nr:PREDICTED: alkylated DNA repair protein alkB homolog 1-like [Saccoglossus kowalevskii]
MAAPGEEIECDMDPFKKQYKKYKRRKPPPDLSEVIDFDHPDRFPDQISKFPLSSSDHFKREEQVLRRFGLTPVDKWKVYSLKKSPGLIYIVNPFLPGYQRYWVKRCLQDFPRVPNLRNMDLYMELDDSDDIWESRLRNVEPSSDSSTKENLLSKLRWVTLGYHYNWSKKEYFGDRKKSELPTDVGLLTQCMASIIGFPQYIAQAGIVNYYNMSSTLGGHVDEAEFDMTAPLISFSFGQTALYLLGGKTRSVKPDAMFLKSGDIMLMSGDSRWAYHSVPRILPPRKNNPVPESFNTTLKSDGLTDELLKPDVEDSSAEEATEVNNDHSAEDPHLDFSDKKDCSHGTSENIVDKINIRTSAYDLNDTKNLSDVFDQFQADMEHLTHEENWKPFAEYLPGARINFNVRQVMEAGKSFTS